MLSLDNSHVIDQLVDIYLKHEWWHKTKLNHEHSERYFEKVFNDGNVIVYEDPLGRVLGYVEFWRLTFHQWGQYVCGVRLNPFKDDVKHGIVCVVNNAWIRPVNRKSHVTKWLRDQFFYRNRDAEYFVGEARRKKSQPIKVFTKAQLVGKMFKGEECYG